MRSTLGATLPPDSLPPSSDGPPALPLDGPRYRDLGLLGVGGMGEVREVEDRLLRRVVAMKLALPGTLRTPEDVAVFLAEARVHAGLVHPHIVPVFDLGELPGGRVYFTMQKVVGRSLGAAIRAVHRGDGAQGWTQRRLVEALQRAAEGVAYAHAAGVIHRDLKPGNILLGAYGEVLVMDWGLARAASVEPGDLAREHGMSVRLGQISGTPAYMPPEQARGEALDPRADVYALGATLYEILAGKAPYAGAPLDVLAAVRRGPPPPLGEGLPAELVELCGRAMAWDRAARLTDAAAVVAGLRSWLDGQRRQAEADALVAEADAVQAEVSRLRAASRREAEAARAGLAALDPWAPESAKAPWWAAQDAAAQQARQADLLEVEWRGRLQGALERVAGMPAATDRLAAHHREAHAAAEARGDTALASTQEALLRAVDRGQHAGYLRGEGRLSLWSDPPAQVELYRYVLSGRRLVAEPAGSLGSTPLVDRILPMGSYLLILRAPGHHGLRLPVAIRREGQHLDLPAGQDQPVVHRLAPLGALSEGEVLVPAGWFVAGDDALGARAWPTHRAWTHAFVIQRDPVTIGEVLEFLNKFKFDGALPPLFRRDGAGVALHPQDDPQLDWPVMRVSATFAAAYAAARAAYDGLPWRLPAEAEWEKAARGVDGRTWPTGPHLDESWAETRYSKPVALHPSPVGRHSDDSPYGVRDLAGNVRCWCADLTPRGTQTLRGGAWNSPVDASQSALRVDYTPDTEASNLGIRLVRSWG